MKIFKLLIPALALLACGSAAAGPRDATGVIVRFGDLNLDSAAGIASLHSRIRNAAQSVCSPLETRILGLRLSYDACVAEAVANGVAAVGNRNLAHHHARTNPVRVSASNRS